MLLRGRGLISQDLVDKVMCWRHSGFDAYFGPPIASLAETVTVGLSIMRPPVAASRLVLEEGPVVRYFAKGIVPGKDTLGLFERESRTFDYIEWMARVTSHIPDRGAHLVHYLGAYSNKHRTCEMPGATESPCSSLDRSQPISTSEWREARRRCPFLRNPTAPPANTTMSDQPRGPTAGGLCLRARCRSPRCAHDLRMVRNLDP